jgi:hypothetical protein
VLLTGGKAPAGAPVWHWRSTALEHPALFRIISAAAAAAAWFVLLIGQVGRCLLVHLAWRWRSTALIHSSLFLII